MKNEEILIVEDDILSATIIKKMLLKKNYKVPKSISTSYEAIEYVNNSQPDLILMDIFLKDEVDGITAAKKIREKYDIPIIYLTSDSSDETIQRAKITEPFGYLLKPVDEKTLITNVELSLQKQHTHNKIILETLRKSNDELEKRVKERTEALQKSNEDLKIEMKQRIQAEEELKRAERLATIGKMSAVLAHEIRNPLNSIKINVDILNQILELSEGNRRRMQIIIKEVTRLDNLVKGVLQFARHSDLVISEFSINHLFENIVHQLKPQFDAAGLTLLNNTENIIINADKEKLEQVFLNMLLNSFDAISEKGEVKVYSEHVNKNSVDIFIRDTGIGIENSGKIFDPFYSTKNTGTGLGLSISQNIIQQHNGNLKLISSNPGETIFCVSLPVKFDENFKT
jgi:signal transduction histidine kinase